MLFVLQNPIGRSQSLEKVAQWRFSTEKKYLFVHFYLITYLVLNLSGLIRLIINRSFFSSKVLKKSPRHRKENSPDTDSNLLS
jgi:hypothetical protein